MAKFDWTRDHVRRYLETGGADGHIWRGHDGKGHFPCLLLTTIGRKSGERRTTPLIYGLDGGNHVVVASQGGLPNHPGWFFNIDADPRVTVQVRADVFAARARAATAEERERLWPMMVGIYPPYEAYRKRASETRDIPVVLLVAD